MTATTRPGDRAALRQLGLGLFELLLVSGLYVVYRLGRLLTVDRTETARAHARLVHHLERALQLPSEATIQQAVHSVRLFEAANVYYLSAHFRSPSRSWSGASSRGHARSTSGPVASSWSSLCWAWWRT